MDHIIKLLEVVIWPATLLSIIFLFRAQFKSVFSRVKDFQANTSGLSMSFSEKLEATKKMANNLKAKSISKSATAINPDPQLAKLRSLEGEVKSYLKLKGSSVNIDIENKSIQELNAQLKEKGLIKFNKAELIKAFSDLSEAATSDISEHQIKEIKEIVKSITS